ncbi:PIN domain-containing protein [Kitasatospora sp. NPDC056181]|uniref:PIN domain-containing protein n=1 Tax=Kitasatospora sp. NPDC056181 TaxID=3345737 RepID=UPI0035E317BD
MIIFDTNALNNIQLGSPRADILRKFRASAQHRVAVPWMVLEELVAHRAMAYMAAREAARIALNGLRKAAPWQAAESFDPPALELEQCQKYWREQYGALFDEVVETGGEAARQALVREALALPPAERWKEKSIGGRDAAIWFSVLDFLRANPEEEVWFVTDDGDFGDGRAYPYPMDQDLGDMADRLHRVTDFDEVVSRFTELVDEKQARAETEALLKSALFRETVVRAAAGLLRSPFGFPGTGSGSRETRWGSFLVRPQAGLLSFEKVEGHRIGDDVWCTAETTWVLHGSALEAEQDGMDVVTCLWTVKLLFSTAAGGQEAPTILRTDEPTVPEPADTSVEAVIATLREEVFRMVGVNGRASGRRRLTVGELVGLAGASQLHDVVARSGLAGASQLREAIESFASTHMTVPKGVIAKSKPSTVDFASTLRWHQPSGLEGALLRSIAAELYTMPLFELDMATEVEETPNGNVDNDTRTD